MMAEGPHSEGGPLRPQHIGDAREVNDTHTPSRAKSPGSQEPSTDEERPRPQQGEVEAPGSDGVRGPPTAPDGGWGWAVLLATVLVMALTLSFSSCVGVFYTDLQAEFSASNTQTSWVPAIMIAVLHAGGPLCSVLVERFGCRATIMAGGALSGLSMASGSLARTIGELYITSALTGLGFSLSMYPSLTMISRYFVRRRAFANATASMGTALGYSVLPALAHRLRGGLGWRGGFLVLGAVLLHCCACGAVMRPVMRPVARHELRPVARRDPRPGGQEDRPENTTAVANLLRRHMACDLLLGNAHYRAYAAALTCALLGYLVPQVYLVPYAIAHRVEPGSAALLLSVIGMAGGVSRLVAATVMLLVPACSRGGGRGLPYVLGGALVVNGLSNSACGAWPSFPALLGYAVVFGASQGLMAALVYAVLMELVDADDFPRALGLVSLLQGGVLLAGPPLAGMLVDATGQYSYVFHACNVVVTSGGLFLLGSFCYLDRRKDGRVARTREREDKGAL